MSKEAIKWGKDDTCLIQGKPFLRAGARYREFYNENPDASWDSSPLWGDAGDYAVTVTLRIKDRSVTSTCADNLHKNTKPHLSAILETRAKSRCIALFSTRYTLDGEMATAEDVMDARDSPKTIKPAPKTIKPAQESEWVGKVDLELEVQSCDSLDALTKLFKSLPIKQQKHEGTVALFSERKEELQ